MSHLTQRAEQALLGALLADGPAGRYSQWALDALEADDFSHRGHRQVFEALTELRTHSPGLSGDTLIYAVSDRLDSPGADDAWLMRLRDSAGATASVPAYTQMIQTSALRREIASHARRIAQVVVGPLGDALLRNALVHARLTGEDLASAVPTPAVETGSAPSGGVLEPSEDRGPDQGGRRPEMRARYEDLLLADLLQNPEQASELARALPDDTFTTDQRREIYRTVITIAEAGDPVDEVIVAWHMEQQRAIAAMYEGDGLTEPPRPDGPEPDIVYLDRLAATSPVFPAAEIAQFLISEDVRAELASANPSSQVRPGAAPQSAAPKPSRTPLPVDPTRHRPEPPSPARDPRIQP